MTSKEALKCLQPVRWDDKKEIEAYEVLKKLVERDTPMKPEFTNEYAYNFRCSKCKSVIILSEYKKVNFCVKCGQRLNWRGKEND